MVNRHAVTGVVAVALALTAAVPAHAADRVRLLGERTLPHAMDFQGTTVGGLSGIDYDPRTGAYVLISDDRSERQPARGYLADIPVTAGGLGPVALTATRPLLRPDGTTYPAGSLDPEDVRWDPRSGEVWWTSEGERQKGLIDPSVRSATLDGSATGELPLPPNLVMRPDSGPKQNEALEGLTFAADGSLLVSAMEGPLVQDGESPTFEHGALSRLTAQDRSGAVVAQVAYPLDKVFAQSPTGGFANNGVTAILADGDDPFRYLVMERSFVDGVGNSIRIYEVDARDATDVRDVASLAGADVTPVRKTLLADLSELGLSTVDNVEGMTWGPVLPGGERSLVLVSDDNFSAQQTTQVIALGVK
ncbi:esterase-like activity of phytase family protein [Saccharopolyspora erythraea]|uniref:esterase-like activity of phytase family protein n=1 Tax=Saccharopolyspora erythraea TaxID=1836 RepID=UPI001BA9034A|nr:esterase-like activity of phytase family protein [Saccharopolyspora erythraea]QUH05653.1 esterase-like activity of phytase family protein [Saccharopolyspora erythraea]